MSTAGSNSPASLNLCLTGGAVERWLRAQLRPPRPSHRLPPRVTSGGRNWRPRRYRQDRLPPIGSRNHCCVDAIREPLQFELLRFHRQSLGIPGRRNRTGVRAKTLRAEQRQVNQSWSPPSCEINSMYEWTSRLIRSSTCRCDLTFVYDRSPCDSSASEARRTD